MISIVLVAAAIALLFGQSIVAKAKEFAASHPLPKLTPVQWLAAVLIVAAAISFSGQFSSPAPTPTPAPDAGPLTLRGLFSGESAAADAQIVQTMCDELASELEHDGMAEHPFFKTGAAVDELRRRMRELRCRGVSIGARQPRVRDAIAAHLESAVGTSGGPLSPEARAAWVTAFRDIGRAAADATR